MIKIFENNSDKPRWWRILRLITLLLCVFSPFVWLTSFMIFDRTEYYWSKVFLVIVVDTYPFYLFLLNHFSLFLYRKYSRISISLAVYSIPIVIILCGIVWFNIGPMPSSELDKGDIRNYWFTPASDLASSILKEDTLNIQRILTENPKLKEFRNDFHNESMLFFAFDNGKIEALKTMIECGSDPNELDSHGQSILHILAMGGCKIRGQETYLKTTDLELNFMNWMLTHGADPNLVTGGTQFYDYGPKLYITPLQALFYYGPDSSSVLTVLLDHGAAFRSEEEKLSSIEAAKMRNNKQIVNTYNIREQ